MKDKTELEVEYFMEVDGELQRLFDWLQDSKREPAQTKFTSGMLRNVAREVEYLIKHSR